MTFFVPFMELSSLSYPFRQGGAHGPLHFPIQHEIGIVVANVHLSGGVPGIQIGKW